MTRRVPYPLPTSAAVTQVMKGNRRTGTRPEQRLRSELHRRGMRFRKDFPIRTGEGMLVRPDVVFTRLTVAVFIDGCFWHYCPQHGRIPRMNTSYWSEKLNRNRLRDATQTEGLERWGWRVVRAWEHEDVQQVADRVERVIRSPG